MKAEEIIKLLDLRPLTDEGGYYRESYRSVENIPSAALPQRYRAKRSFSTAIYYLLTPDNFSAMHKVESDEVFHFYLGDPVLQLCLHEDGRAEKTILGTDLEAGQRPQSIVSRGVWQGARLVEGGSFALLGTTVAPGFDFEDFCLGARSRLVKEYPDLEKLIVSLTDK